VNASLVALLLVGFAVLLWPSHRRGPVASPARRTTSPRGGAGTRSARWPGSRNRGGGSALDEALAELLALIEASLRTGAPPATVLAALRGMAGGGPVGGLVADLHTAACSGRPLGPVWQDWADEGNPSLHFVARAWSLSDHTGAPLADALACAVSTLRARRRSRQRLASAVAGPRASLAVLAVLPAAGPVVGFVCGVSPMELYLGRPAATASVLVGLALGVLALWWSRRIIARAR
jgi:tight adherence protein B